ncbi:SAM-dependent methyltransferase [Amorphus suaedae]
MSLQNLKNDEGQLWLNVASSHYPIDGFVNLDNHVMMIALDRPYLLPFIPRRNKNLLEAYREARAKGVFVRHDCRQKLPVPDSTVDHILCSHFLEHVFPDEGRAILADFKRALKPGATMHIIVPDLEVLARRYVEQCDAGSPTAADEMIERSLLSKPDRGSWQYRAMEFSGGFGLGHRWMYDQNSMRARIVALGFEMLEGNDTPSRAFRQGDDSVHVVARKPR